MSRTKSANAMDGLSPIKMWMWSDIPLIEINFWPLFLTIPVMYL